MNKKTLRIILIVLIIFWMCIVFGFSNENAEDSSSLSFKIANFLVKNEEIARKIEPYIRKIAHLSEYTIRRIFILWIFFNI